MWLVTGLAVLALWSLLSVWVPPENPQFAICFSRRVLHFPCPGCGLTRAFAHLAKGEWLAAFRLHPLAPFLAPEGAFLWAAWGLMLTGHLRPPTITWVNRWLSVHL
ncbi:DUF2752 domain-containing protein, partial [Acidobacteria bacterium AH-259-L09]|nr:DUF2752 domain-containing protein [Acidobacteria bacterium AH-259-L09]